MDITGQGTAMQERCQAYRDQAGALSHTGSFGWNSSSRELVCSDENFRILEDDPSVNRHSIYFDRIHPEDLSSAGPRECQRQSEANFPFPTSARAVQITMEATQAFM